MKKHEKPQKSTKKPPATELRQDELDGVAGGRGGTGKRLPPLVNSSPARIWDTSDDGVVFIGEVTLESGSPPKKKRP